MRRFISQDTERFLIVILGGGTAVEISDKVTGLDTCLQGDDADIFQQDLENMQLAFQNPNSAWYGAGWDNCLAELTGEILAAANPDRSFEPAM